ncbi:MAG: hypothetical protein M3P33_00030 [bacterium]|nr:hypothetical protein [bacterium]
MIYLLHGNNLIASRKKLQEIKSQFSSNNITELVVRDVNYNTLELLFNTVSMFDEKRLVVIEGKIDSSLVNLGRVSDHSDADLLIWVDSLLRSNDSLITNVTKLGGTILSFEEKVDTSIFLFLDAIAKRNRIQSMKEYYSLLDYGVDVIYIHTMLVWQFRMILVPEKASGFVKKKVLEFNKNFNFEELGRIYYSLLQIEIQLKTGMCIPHVILEQFVIKVTK